VQVNESLKQRLVGALILIALAVVFWPIIFVQPGEKGTELQRRIPPRPDVSATPLSAPDQVGLRGSRTISALRENEEDESIQPIEIVEANEVTDVVPAQDPPSEGAVQEPLPGPEKTAEKPAPDVIAAVTRSEAPTALELDGDGVPVAWILQIASVSSADKADELRSQLLEMKHKAYVKKVVRGDKTLYRVYLGPKFEREKLEKLRGDIDTRFGVTSMTLRYTP
jgi:DedD protein